MSCCANTGRSVPKVITGVQRRLTPAQCLEALNIIISYLNYTIHEPFSQCKTCFWSVTAILADLDIKNKLII